MRSVISRLATIGALTLCLAGSAAVSFADVFASWNNGVLNTPGAVSSTQGNAALLRGGAVAFDNQPNQFATVNWPAAVQAPPTFAGEHIDFLVDTTNHHNIHLNFGLLRNVPGPNLFRIYYSIDAGASFTPITPNTTTPGIFSFDFSSVDDIEDHPFVIFRLHAWQAANAFGGIALQDISFSSDNPPLANDDSFSVAEDGVLIVAAPGVLGNDTDVEGDPITSFLVDGPVNGAVLLAPTGGFIYTPTPGYNGPDSFTYIANDGNYDSTTATVSLNVLAVNDVPVAVDDAYNGTEDEVLSIAAPGVLGNDSDVESGLTASIVANALNGNVVLNPDGSFDYTPDPDFAGIDTFTYQANDGSADSNVVVVEITVANVNDPPFANDDAFGTSQDSNLVVAAPGILSSDGDIDGDPITAVLISNALNGDLTLSSDGGFTYDPDPSFSGTDFFSYVANDGTSNSTVATVSILVGVENDAPTAVPDTYDMLEDTTLTIAAPGLIINDTDPDNDPLSATLVLGPLHGVLTLQEDGSFEYAPDENYTGPDAFRYRVTDGVATSNVAIVEINVLPQNDAPVANPDEFSTVEGSPLNVSAPGILSNDLDIDGDTLTAVLQTGPASGSLALNGTGDFIYTPNAAFSGTDEFTYTASDGLLNSEVTTVTINVGAVDNPPVGVADVYTVYEDTVLSATAPGVLGNDIDPDSSGSLTALLITDVHSGVLAFQTDGSFEYTPNPNFHGVDTFIYRVSDGTNFSDPVLVTINVLPVNDLPEANFDAYSTPEETPLVVAAPGVLGNDVDVDGDALIALLVDNPTSGILELNGNGSFKYTPNVDFVGFDQFTYQAHDGTGNSEITTVTIAVGVLNDPPVAVNDAYVAVEDTPLVVPVPGILGNDTDADGHPISAVLITPPLHGTLTLFPGDGSFTYTPNANYAGLDSFVYQASDGFSLSNVATVTITVQPVNDPPVAVNDAYSTPEDVPLVVAAPGIMGNDSDPDGNPLTALLVDNPSNGVLALNGNGSFTYTPNPGYSGPDLFRYVVFDGTLNSALAEVSINVTNVNDIPVAVNETFNALEDVPLVIPTPGVLTNDTDADNDPLTANLLFPPLHGTVVLNLDGSFTYTPNANFFGVDSFVYRAHDGTTFSNTATVTINVGTVNDNPTITNLVISTPIVENGNATITGIINENDIGDSHSVTVDWGDGTLPQVVNYPAGTSFFSITHQYLDDDPTGTPSDLINVNVSISDTNSGSSAYVLPLTVNNVDPQLVNVFVTPAIFSNTLATLTGNINEIGTKDTFTLMVDWGDGSPAQVVLYPAGTTSFNLTHLYALGGNYAVVVTLIDDDTGTDVENAAVAVTSNADLSLVKTGTPDPSIVGETITYSLVVTNHGPDLATNVVVTDTVPANLIIESFSDPCINTSGSLSCSLGDMAVGDRALLTIVVRSFQQGPVSNIASVEADQTDPNPANNISIATTTVGAQPPADGPDLFGTWGDVTTSCRGRVGRETCQINGVFLFVNRGTDPAIRSIQRFFLSDDSTWDLSDKQIIRKAKKMKAGETSAMKIRARLPRNVFPTGKFLIAVLDDGNVVGENNETNNIIVYGPLP